MSTRLILIDGLPGVGKTTIARELARTTGGLHLRIDSIEQALRNGGLEVRREGYVVGYAVAEDNLRLGQMVIADCVNPWPLTRSAWRDVAARVGVGSLDVDVVCSDQAEHRRRVESRAADIPGHLLPTWQDVLERDYYPWDTEPRLVIDTALVSVDAAVGLILHHLSQMRTDSRTSS
jgi:predicted kinase